VAFYRSVLVGALICGLISLLVGGVLLDNDLVRSFMVGIVPGLGIGAGWAIQRERQQKADAQRRAADQP
jgi:uncharacterized membrane protein